MIFFVFFFELVIRHNMAENFGGCFYVVARLIPKPIQRLYGRYIGENLDKINPARAKLTYVTVKTK